MSAAMIAVITLEMSPRMNMSRNAKRRGPSRSSIAAIFFLLLVSLSEHNLSIQTLCRSNNRCKTSPNHSSPPHNVRVHPCIIPQRLGSFPWHNHKNSLRRQKPHR